MARDASGLLYASLPKKWISMSMLCCSFASWDWISLLILGPNRVMVWSLWWCVYMHHVIIYLHVHFLP